MGRSDDLRSEDVPEPKSSPEWTRDRFGGFRKDDEGRVLLAIEDHRVQGWISADTEACYGLEASR